MEVFPGSLGGRSTVRWLLVPLGSTSIGSYHRRRVRLHAYEDHRVDYGGDCEEDLQESDQNVKRSVLQFFSSL